MSITIESEGYKMSVLPLMVKGKRCLCHTKKNEVDFRISLGHYFLITNQDDQVIIATNITVFKLYNMQPPNVDPLVQQVQ